MNRVHIGKMNTSLSWCVDHCNKLLPLLNEARHCTTDLGKMMLILPGLMHVADNKLDRVLLAEKIIPQLNGEQVTHISFVHQDIELLFDESSHLQTIQEQFNEKRSVPA